MTFQDGAGAYTGTSDTFIDTALGSQATVAIIVVDSSPVEQILIRFDGIVGSGAGQIPQGSTISSATLTLRVGGGTNDQSANPVNFHRLLHPWIDTDVWAAYGVPPWNATAGIQADGVDAVSTAEATATMTTASTAYPVSVTGSVQAWATNPTSNYGWVILPTGTDGLRLESSDSTTLSYRPVLSVTFTPPSAGCTVPGDCDDGLWCNGAETCNTVTSQCQAGIAPVCNDDTACTTDSCNESADQCVFTPSDAACSDGLFCNGVETCATGTGCQAGTPVSCPGQVCSESLDRCAECDTNTDCQSGETCNLATGLCEINAPLQAGDVIISGFQETNTVTGHGSETSEFIELFNTTDRVISLESMNVIIRDDVDPGDGIVQIDWQLSTQAPNLTGKQIAPHSFFLIGEAGVLAPGGNFHDLAATLDLTTAEGGVAERAISIELVVNGTHMDYVLYGRHDGSTPAGELPPGDIPFSGFGGSSSTLVPAGSSWRYLDNGSNQGTAWKEVAFADGGWSQGNAELGYGDAPVTTVNCGPSAPACTSGNYITTYFRQHFTVANPASIQGLTLRLQRDDGAAVYLNGTEIRRDNLAAGAAYDAIATATVSGTDESTFFSSTVDPALLVAGDNVLAVEVHQVGATSSDVSFDLELTATTGPSGARTEVIRNTLGGDSFLEGLVRREGADALYAGHAIEGFYTDEVAQGDGYPVGVWTSPHVATYGSYEARNSLSPQVFPGGVQRRRRLHRRPVLQRRGDLQHRHRPVRRRHARQLRRRGFVHRRFLQRGHRLLRAPGQQRRLQRRRRLHDRHLRPGPRLSAPRQLPGRQVLQPRYRRLRVRRRQPAGTDRMLAVEQPRDAGEQPLLPDLPHEPRRPRRDPRLPVAGLDRPHGRHRVAHTQLPGRCPSRGRKGGLPLHRPFRRLPGSELRALPRRIDPADWQRHRRLPGLPDHLRRGRLGRRHAGHDLRGPGRTVPRLGAGRR